MEPTEVDRGLTDGISDQEPSGPDGANYQTGEHDGMKDGTGVPGDGDQTHSDPWDGFISSLSGHGDHATGECPYPCPVCMGIGLVKQMNPEIASHLASSAREFMLAAKAFMDNLAETQQHRSTASKIEKIPFD
ncbi:MAG: hypothetical protein ABR507_10175 [Actinomycetota bacterium]|nr:hypothetical protein [Actinomycetota bacterium]